MHALTSATANRTDLLVCLTIAVIIETITNLSRLPKHGITVDKHTSDTCGFQMGALTDAALQETGALWFINPINAVIVLAVTYLILTGKHRWIGIVTIDVGGELVCICLLYTSDAADES